MNGFANSLLSILLSWIRALVANIWQIINSEDGGTMYRFFADHWTKILLFLLIAGFLIDRIVYFFRWRPYYVWLSRWDRLRGRRRRPEPELVFSSEPIPEIAAPTAVYQPVPAQPAVSPTIAYAPAKRSRSRVQEVYTQIYTPAQMEPLFDEPVTEWEEDWQEEPVETPATPEPNAYYRDVQAGFAPAISPEQLYAPRSRSAAKETPVHPGLDAESFRQNFGLQEEAPQPVPVMRAPVFRPFTVKEETVPQPQPSALTRFARRARNLVGVEDDSQQLSIRDLQSTVDVSKAFHDPVYPQNMKINE